MHCADVRVDRAVGQFWEKAFAILAARAGRTVYLHQVDRSKAARAYRLRNGRWKSLIAPDVSLLDSPAEHHEVKHKTVTTQGCFGLEEYRFESLLELARETQEGVFLTVHDHHGYRDCLDNKIEDWVTANILDLARHRTRPTPGRSYVDGKIETVKIYYWPVALFIPLADHLYGPGPRPLASRLAPSEPEVEWLKAA